MAIVAVFNVPGMTLDQYDQVIKGLDDAGYATPDGRIFHVMSIVEGGLQAVDVWESEEKLMAFGETMMPIIAATGATPPQPTITQVHNILQ